MSDSALKHTEALSCIVEIKKILLPKGQYLDIQEQYKNGTLKFFKIEASIMVKE